MNHREPAHDKRDGRQDSGLWQKIAIIASAIFLAFNGTVLILIAFPDLAKETKSTDWALVFLTGAYVVVASLQFLAMRRTVDTMRESTRVASDALDHGACQQE